MRLSIRSPLFTEQTARNLFEICTLNIVHYRYFKNQRGIRFTWSSKVWPVRCFVKMSCPEDMNNPYRINKGIIEENVPSCRNKSQSLSLVLSDEDKEKLRKQDTRLVSSFQAKNLELNAQKYWDLFYKRNTTKFFKDRHWTTREFHELIGNSYSISEEKLKLLELGCGVGNLIFPLIEENINMEFFACDFSPRAVEFVKNNELYKSGKINVFQADIVKDNLLAKTKTQVDIVTAVFVLSAIHPDNFTVTIKNIFQVLKPGGLILIRDYGLYDMTQIRFKPGHKISDNFYMRQDGTRSYFFTIEQLRDLFLNEGFEQILCCYVQGRTVNKKEEINVPRTFVQAKFKKSMNFSSAGS